MFIQKVRINNYRSLKNISIDGLETTTVFFGENNAGKSNILNLLHLIFERKAKANPDDGSISQIENFYSGIFVDAENNYYNGDISNPILFEVEIKCIRSELKIDPMLTSFFKGREEFIFLFKGNITPKKPFVTNYSDFSVTAIEVDKKVIYKNSNSKFSYFPTLDKDEKKIAEFSSAFSKLVNVFNDCVYVIGRDRDMHITDISYEDVKILSPATFKKFLHHLYLSPTKHKIFERIDKIFSEDPFGFGHISFSTEGRNLEIAIKENDLRLPIKNLGSGVLQSLYIITSIVCSQGKIICIEEPEQNLSPLKQKDILKKIQTLIGNSNESIFSQLIISSHSPVYRDVNIKAIFLIGKSEGETVVTLKDEKDITKKLDVHFAPSYPQGIGRGSKRGLQTLP